MTSRGISLVRVPTLKKYTVVENVLINIERITK